MGLNINIDNGGTLTDFCVTGGATIATAKTLTTPYDLSKCLFDGLKRLSGNLYGEENLARLLEETDYIRYSTTQGTNAIVERKGPKLGLLLDADGEKRTAALRALDPELYDALVGSRVAVVDPAALGTDEGNLAAQSAITRLTAAGANRLVVSFAGPRGAADEQALKKMALRRFPRHLLGAVPLSFASELTTDADETRRCWTALINSFLHPAMESFLYNAENRLRAFRTRNPLLIFKNDGAASRVAKSTALKSYSSGPRGGMEGVREFAQLYGLGDVLSMDVGGTTTDIGQVIDGRVFERHRGAVEGIEISFPLCEIVSPGAGGSSIFRVRDGAITVGPDSVGAAPGPACFGRGGTLATMTDAMLLLGVFDPKSFFGGALPIDPARARSAIEQNIAGPLGVSLEEALFRMLEAYENKIATELRRFGRIGPKTALLAFGGAGPLNACGVAERAGIRTVIVPRMAAVFSAYGIGSSNIGQHYATTLADTSGQAIAAAVQALTDRARLDMFAEGLEEDDYSISTRLAITRGGETFHAAFNAPLMPGDVVELQLVAEKVLKSEGEDRASVEAAGKAAAVAGTRRVIEEGRGALDLPLYAIAALNPGDGASGPAILEDDYFTCRIPAGWSFTISELGDAFITRKEQ